MFKTVKVDWDRNKKTAPRGWFLKKKEKKRVFYYFFLKMFLKIFEFSFILDQSQVCSSNGLNVRACQSELIFCSNAFFYHEITKLNMAMFLLILMPFLNKLG